MLLLATPVLSSNATAVGNTTEVTSNVTVGANFTLANSTFPGFAALNSTSANASISVNELSTAPLNVTEGANFRLPRTHFGFSNLTADQLIQQLNTSQIQSLELKLDTLIDHEFTSKTATITEQPQNASASATAPGNGTITFSSLFANSNTSALNTSRPVNGSKTTPQNATFVTFSALQNSSTHTHDSESLNNTIDSSSNSGSNASTVDIETVENAETLVHVVSHSLENAILTAVDTIEQAAKTQDQVQAVKATTTQESISISTVANAPSSASSDGSSASIATWIPVGAAVGALVAIVGSRLSRFRSAASAAATHSVQHRRRSQR
ncbi:hypothetical protein FI667_g10675, partial [Globisporangium splendens]